MNMVDLSVSNVGLGSTGIAAKNKGFNFIGIEMEFDYFNIAKERIKNNKE